MALRGSFWLPTMQSPFLLVVAVLAFTSVVTACGVRNSCNQDLLSYGVMNAKFVFSSLSAAWFYGLHASFAGGWGVHFLTPFFSQSDGGRLACRQCAIPFLAHFAFSSQVCGVSLDQRAVSPAVDLFTLASEAQVAVAGTEA